MTATMDVYTSAASATPLAQSAQDLGEEWFAVSSAPGAWPEPEAIHPVPDAGPALLHFRSVLSRLEPQADEGDLAGLTEEIASWSSHRARATQPLVDDDG